MKIMDFTSLTPSTTFNSLSFYIKHVSRIESSVLKSRSQGIERLKREGWCPELKKFKRNFPYILLRVLYNCKRPHKFNLHFYSFIINFIIILQDHFIFITVLTDNSIYLGEIFFSSFLKKIKIRHFIFF